MGAWAQPYPAEVNGLDLKELAQQALASLFKVSPHTYCKKFLNGLLHKALQRPILFGFTKAVPKTRYQ